jgi:short-subunit dehydrogenase
MVAAAAAELGPIDVLINNAGVISVGPLAEMTREDFERLLAVSFWGAYNTVEAVLPGMRQRGAGRVVNISSVGGKVSVPHLLPYSVGKFALTGYSQGLRSALAAEGIVVTTVCPGLMRTGSPPNAQFKGHNEAEYAWFTVGDSLPLLSTSAESAAAAILAACRRGDAEITLTLPAKVAVVMHALFPEQTAELLSLVDRLLPGPGGVGSAAVAGWDSGAATPAWLTVLTQWAARRNNEISPLQG